MKINADDIEWLRRLLGSRIGTKLRKKLEVDDYCQETFLSYLKYFSHIDDKEEFRAIMVRVSINVIYKQARYFNTKKRTENYRQKDSHFDGDLVVDKEERQSRIFKIQKLLPVLSQGSKTIVGLRILDNMPFEEIAQRLGCTTDFAVNFFNSAIRKMKRYANPYNYNPNLES